MDPCIALIIGLVASVKEAGSNLAPGHYKH